MVLAGSRVSPWLPAMRVYVPVFVAAAVVFRLSSDANARPASLLVAALAAGLVLPVLARYPTLVICLLLAVFPLQLASLGWLYTHGLPAGLVRQLGALKDLMAVALVVRALQDRSTHRSRPSDPWLAAYVLIATAYLVLPAVLDSLAPLPATQRLLAWRIDCFFPIVFLAVRRIDPAALDLRVIRGVVIGLATLVAGIAVFEYYEPDTWKQFLYSTMGVQRYSAEVLAAPLSPDTLIRRGINGTVRSKALISDPVFCAFYLLPGLFLVVTRISSRRWFGSVCLTAVIGAGLLATSTRAAAIVALLGVALASSLILRSGRRIARYLAPVMVGMVLLLPVVAAQSPVLARVVEAAQGQDASAKGHADDFQVGLDRARAQPLGTGLGTGAGVGQRFGVENTVISENAYLQVINELGFVALIAFLGFLLVLSRELRARGREGDDRFLDRVAALALLLAMFVGGFFQQVWYDFSVSVLVGVVLALPQMARLGEVPAEPAGQQPAVLVS